MRPTLLLPMLLLSTQALALDATCETYLAAAEKSAKQPARHSISEPGDGSSHEAIIVDGKFFSNLGGDWQVIPGAQLLKGELKMIEQIRAGKYPMTNCRKAGSERFEGVSTSVITYTLTMPGMAPAETRTFIGADGLVYGQSSGGMRVRHRYTGVKAPL